MSRSPMLGVVVAVAGSADGVAAEGVVARPVRPGEQLAGLSLLLRALLGLQRGGADRLTVVVGVGDRDAAARAARDERLRKGVAEIVVEETARPEAIVAALRKEVHEPFLLLFHHVVLDPAILARLVEPLPDGVVARLAHRDGQPLGALYARPVWLADQTSLSLDALGASVRARAPEVELFEVGQAYAVTVASPASRHAAVHALFEACRKPVDGFVSRHLNRHVSLFISRRIVETRISPNAMTGVTFLVGLAAAAVALLGGYWPTLVGAALMQANSILDGVDGELARVRHQGSKLGQWLDTIGDDASNLLFYAALAVGARAEPHGVWLATAGWVVTASTFFAALLYYTELAGSGSGDLYSIEWSFERAEARSLGARLLRWGHLLLKQDTFIFLWLCAAAAGYLHQTLPVFATGGVITVIAAALRRLARWRGRRRAEAARAS